MRILIIGDGVAGHTAAVEVRERDPEARITIISDEEYPFYDRVGLKKLVEGKVEASELIKADEDFYESKNIDLELGNRVKSVDPDNKEVETDKRVYKYDKLLIAAGGRLRSLDIAKSNRENVIYLWNLRDAKEMDERMSKGQKAVVVGGGFLGLEMSFSLRKRGLDVDYLIRENHWGVLCVTPESADLIQSEITEQGIDFYTDIEVEGVEFEGENCKVLADGEEFDCDTLVVCIGLVRNLDFLEGSGIETGSGVVTNKYLETNKEDVYAAGDIAEYYDPLLGHNMLNGSWPSAKKQGEIVALNIVGERKPFNFLNSHIVNHFDLSIMTLGDVWISDNKDTYTKREGDSCVQLVTENKEIVGAVLINDLSAISEIKSAVKNSKSLEGLNLAEDFI